MFELFQVKTWIYKLAGEHTYGETPDPFPNSEAKPVRPMVVLRGESRWLPALWRPIRENESAFSFALDNVYPAIASNFNDCSCFKLNFGNGFCDKSLLARQLAQISHLASYSKIFQLFFFVSAL